MRTYLFSLLVSLTFAASAAAVLVDDEPGNDLITSASVQFRAGATVKSDAGVFTITSNDDDFISLGTLRKLDTVTVVTSPIADLHNGSQARPRCRPWIPLFEGSTACFGIPDTTIEIWTEADTSLATGDDAENSDLAIEDHGSLIRFQVTEDNEYFVFIYGFDANEVGEYLVMVVVEPNIECSDGFDNDGDGDTDLVDSGCRDAADASERPDCMDGLDNDGDGFADLEDVGCTNATFRREDPQCQDGVDNDGEGRFDFDGGVSIYGFAVSDPDPQCQSAGSHRESPKFCGIGFELSLLLPVLMTMRRRRTR